MTIRPGHRAIIVVAELALLSVGTFLWPTVLWLVGAAVVAILLIAANDFRHAVATGQKLEIYREVPRSIGRNRPVTVTLKLKNGGTLPIVGEVRDESPNGSKPSFVCVPVRLEAGETNEYYAEYRFPNRGAYLFERVWLRIYGPLHLVEVQWPVECISRLRVFPEVFSSPAELQAELRSSLLALERLCRSRERGTGTDFVALDEYREGDDVRRIDWTASSRVRHPIVRRYQVERHREVLILIDSGRQMGGLTKHGSKLDCAVDAALNLAQVAIRSGDRCGVGVFDSSLSHFIAPATGAAGLQRIVDTVYDVQTRWRESDLSQVFVELQRRQSKRCFIIILSDLGDTETSRIHRLALERLSKRHLVLFAAIKTPLLGSILLQPAATISEGASQVVAMGLLRDRSRALHTLRHGGVQVLDTEPQHLTVPLINRFIQLRQRNLL